MWELSCTLKIFRNLRRLEGQQNTHHTFLKCLDMICLAINYYHLAMKKLYISTLEFDFSTYQNRDLRPKEISTVQK